MSYNSLRFAAPWLLLYFAWLIVRVPLVKKNDCRKFLINGICLATGIAIIYLLTGLHLILALLTPAFFAASGLNKEMPRNFRRTAWGFLFACALAFPIANHFAPYSYSEPMERQKVSQIRREMEATADKLEVLVTRDARDNRTAIDALMQSIHDPFAIKPVSNPFSILTFGFGGYQPLPKEQSLTRFITGTDGFAIWSRGPDRSFNPAFKPVIQSAVDGSSVTLETFAYDPTNGTISPGDLWLLRNIDPVDD